MKRLQVLILLLSVLWAVGHGEAAEPRANTSHKVTPAPTAVQIVLATDFSPVYAGDLIFLRGKQRFNSGQMQGITFRIGPRTVVAEISSPDEAILGIPRDLPSGKYLVQILKHEEPPGRDKVLFSQTLDIVASTPEILASKTVKFDATGEIIEFPGFAQIEAAADQSRVPKEVTFSARRSEFEARYLRREMVSGADFRRHALPAVAANLQYLIEASNPVLPLALRVSVPEDFIQTIPSGFQPALYAQIIECGADGEQYYTYIELSGTYDSGRRLLVVDIPDRAWTVEDCGDVEGSARVASNASTRLFVDVRLAVRRIGQIDACYSGGLTAPLTRSVSRGDVVPIHGTFSFKAPAPLLNPTARPLAIGSGFTGNAGRGHLGVDFFIPAGDPVYAAAGGTVHFVGTDTGRDRIRPLVCPYAI